MLVNGWNALWEALPNSGAIGTILAVIGVLIIVLALLKWAWERRRGSVNAQGFPWMALVFAAILAGPNITLPIILGIGDALINLVGNVIKWVTGQF